MEFFKRVKAVGVIGGLILIGFGLFMLIKPVMVGILFDWIIGAVLLVCGIFQVMTTIMIRKELEHVWARLLPGISMIILGAFVLIYESATVFMIGIVIAVFAFSLAFDRFAVAVARFRQKECCSAAVFFGIIHLLFGCFMLYNAFAMIAAMIMIGGIYLIVAGLLIMLSVFKFKDL